MSTFFISPPARWSSEWPGHHHGAGHQPWGSVTAGGDHGGRPAPLPQDIIAPADRAASLGRRHS